MKLKEAISQRFNLSLTHTGWQTIHCPLIENHSDKNASAAINLSFGYFKCMGCSSNLKLIDFWKEIKERKIKTIDKSVHNIVSTNGHKVGYQIQEMVNFLNKKKLSLSTIEDNRGSYVGNPDDEFYGYLVFKLFDGSRTGRRIINNGKPRFLNEKNRVLLGAENIPNYDTLILVEGITDYLSLWELGRRDIVCSLGSELSDAQAYLLRGKQVIIIYDRDYAGAKGAKKAQKVLNGWGANAVIPELPAMFGNGISKIDVSDAYVNHKDTFTQWLKEEVGKYQSNDIAYIQNIRNRKKLVYYPTGLDEFDESLGGGFTQGVYYLAGKTSVGKSTLLSSFVRSQINHKRRVAWFTYELPIDQVWARYASTYSQHSWVDIEKDSTLLEDKVIAQLLSDSSYLKICSDPTTEDIIARCRYSQVLVFDYIQTMPTLERDPNNAVRVNNKLMSSLAMQGKTVICVSSLAMSNYNNDNDSLVKGSGDGDYTMQVGLKLHRLGENRIGYRFTKNTRGKTKNGIFVVDWQHQIIKGVTDEFETS